MTNTDLLLDKIEKSGLKRSYIAKSLDLTTYGLANKIYNRSEFKSGEINTLCKLLRIEDLEEKERIFFAC